MLTMIATFVVEHPIISSILLNFGASYYLKRKGVAAHE